MTLDIWRARLNSLREMAAWLLRFGLTGTVSRFAAMNAARQNGFNQVAYQEAYPDVGALHPLVHYAATGPV